MNDCGLNSFSKIAYWQNVSEQERGSWVRNDNDKCQRGNHDENIKLTHADEVEGTISSSQDFCLKLSQNSTTTNTCNDIIDYAQRNDVVDTIVISDSSSESFSPKYPLKGTYQSKKNYPQDNGEYNLISSDSESSDIEFENLLRLRNANKKQDAHRFNHSNVNRIIKKNNGLFSSDESRSSSSESSKLRTSSSNKTDSTHVSPTPQSVEYTIKKSSKITSLPKGKHGSTTNTFLSCSTSSSSSNVCSQNNTVKNPGNSLHKKNNNIKNTLTRKDTYNILKNIKSTRAVHQSPRELKENNVIIDESIDDDVHPAISSDDNLRMKHVLIDETPVDLERDIINDSQVDLTNPYKTHVSRFLDAPDTDKQVNNVHVELSERKKKQISQWLMTNSPDSRSDSSFSNVPPSNRDSVSSGNSSLERLEMNYETPNNRGKVSRVSINEKGPTIADCNTIVNSPLPRQPTLHQFVEKSKNDTFQFRTPKNHRITKAPVSASTSTEPRNVDIANCAHILDKLYGNAWREKADRLLPLSEPRKQVTATTSAKTKLIQTDRKVVNKNNLRTAISAKDDANTPLQNTKSQYNPVQKSLQRNHKLKDSFINDETSSDSGSESLYYTAMTNPRISTNSVPSNTVSTKPTPVPATVKRAILLCDTESENEDDNSSNRQSVDVTRRRRLLFSDSEDNGSSTSEFDPGDNVPPKPPTRKERFKTPRQVSRTNRNIESSTLKNQKNQGQNKFLSSLSESVPIAQAHPDAKKYRTDFKNNKDDLCKYLFKLYNEQVFDKKLPEDMLIEWNVRMRGTAGFCYNKKSIKTLGGVVKSSRIVLSTKVLDTPDRLRDTLIHEMCHAAAWLINNVSDGHGQFWTGWAMKAMRTFPELPPIRRCHDYKIKTKFTYRCVGCGYSIGRHSKSLDVEKKRCGHCYGKFELLLNKSTKSGIVQVQTPKRQPSAFALYVKENYSSIKKEANMKHADVMKLLGQQFSAIKIAKQAPSATENDSEAPG